MRWVRDRACFASGKDHTVLEIVDVQWVVGCLKAFRVSPTCPACHQATSGEIQDVLNVSFGLVRIRAVGPELSSASARHLRGVRHLMVSPRP